jgi:predicted DNA-binding transcriptional regulator AlpA
MPRNRGSHVIDSNQLAERFGTTPQAIYSWRVRGEGPPFVRMPGNRIRYRVADVEAWENSRLMDRL